MNDKCVSEIIIVKNIENSGLFFFAYFEDHNINFYKNIQMSVILLNFIIFYP